jgi:hypothetical protein
MGEIGAVLTELRWLWFKNGRKWSRIEWVVDGASAHGSFQRNTALRIENFVENTLFSPILFSKHPFPPSKHPFPYQKHPFPHQKHPFSYQKHPQNTHFPIKTPLKTPPSPLRDRLLTPPLLAFLALAVLWLPVLRASERRARWEYQLLVRAFDTFWGFLGCF